MNRIATRRSSSPGLVLAVAALALLAGCDERAVQHTVRIDLTTLRAGLAEIAIPVTIETRFEPPESRSPEDEELIQEALDLHALGRDPWTRGLQRAGTGEPTVTTEGPADRPSAIRREGKLPEAGALVAILPDAIANVTLREDARRGTLTLEIVHIDAPGHVRDERRAIERELDAFARLAFDWSDSVCDLYDHLREDSKHWRQVLGRLRQDDDTGTSLKLVDPKAAALADTIDERFEAMLNYLGAETVDGRPVRTISGMTFRPFDWDLEVVLPIEATEMSGFEEVERTEEETAADDGIRYALGAVDALQLLETAVPVSDPEVPLEGWDAIDVNPEERPPFTCRRPRSALSIKESLWDRLLPSAHYELTWPSR